MKSRSMGLVAAAFCLAGLFELFLYADWDYGVARALILGFIAILAVFLNRKSSLKTLVEFSACSVVPLVALASIVLLFSSVVAIQTIGSVKYREDIQLDQGTVNHRAVEMLFGGKNPYGRHAMVDPEMYWAILESLKDYPGCTQIEVDKQADKAALFWNKTYSARGEAEMFFPVAESTECSKLKHELESTGYRYGPIMLLAYAPFFKIFGAAGLYLLHFILFLSIVAVFYVIAKTVASSQVNAIVLWSLLVILVCVPTHMQHNFLILSASDLLPTLLGLLGFLFWLEKRIVLVGIVVGLSIGSKIIPGLLFLPYLLFNEKPKALPIFLCLLLSFGPLVPFLCDDFYGTLNNYFYALSSNVTDSTSLFHFLPNVWRTIIKLVALASILFAFYRLKASGKTSVSGILGVVALMHFFAILAGRYFHNNYLIWPMVITALFVFVPAFYRERENSMA